MSKWARIAIFFTASVVVTIPAMMLLRTYLLDAGGSAYKSGEYTKAFYKLIPLAWLGDSSAQYILGEMYAYGLGRSKDDESAVYWFRRAAVLANESVDPAAPASYAVSEAYANGIRVAPDQGERMRWLRRAAVGGYQEAIKKLEELKGAEP